MAWSNSVPKLMLVSSKAQFPQIFHISAGLLHGTKPTGHSQNCEARETCLVETSVRARRRKITVFQVSVCYIFIFISYLNVLFQKSGSVCLSSNIYPMYASQVRTKQMHFVKVGTVLRSKVDPFRRVCDTFSSLFPLIIVISMNSTTTIGVYNTNII